MGERPGRGIVGPGPAALQVSVRLEVAGDEPAIRSVEAAAFPGPEEADIVDRIRREARAGWQSLVAVDPGGRIVGHLLMSPCPVIGEDGVQVAEVLAIGPVAVLPENPAPRRRLGADVRRHGPGDRPRGPGGGPPRAPRVLRPVRVLARAPAGARPPAPAWPDEAWLARLLPAWTDASAGTVRYPEAFEPLA